MKDLTEQELSEIAHEFQKEIEMMLWSELSITAMLDREKPKVELEYQSDCVYYMNKYWFFLPYVKSYGIGIVNITS
jgi:hypothetical protein